MRELLMGQWSIVGRGQDWVTYMFELVQPLPQLFLLQSEVHSCAWCQVHHLSWISAHRPWSAHHGKLLKLAASQPQGYGLVNLRGRVLQLAGWLSAVAALPQGTSCALHKFLVNLWLVLVDSPPGKPVWELWGSPRTHHLSGLVRALV